MRLRYLWIFMVAVAAVCIGACSKSEEKGETAAQSNLKELAKSSMEENLWAQEGVEMQATLEAAGLEPISYHAFPVQELGKKGRVLTYADKNHKGAGGVIFVKKSGNAIAPAWHWYFKDMVPDSVIYKEINEDGLWDLRIVSTKGKVLELVQDDTFTLTGAERADWIALNVAASAPASPDVPVWHCFDGDSMTVWRSSLASGKEVFVDMPVPLGVSDGILSIRTTDKDQPQNCALYADGHKVQDFEIEPKAALQKIKLDDSVKGANEVRLVVESKYGQGDDVSIAELGLR